MSNPRELTTLIFGGARSGKSSLAEKLCEDSAHNLVYVATSPRFEQDGEMSERIKLHQERRGPRWQLFEEQVNLAEIIEQQSREDVAILIDCMTLWLNNLLYLEQNLAKQVAHLCQALQGAKGPVLLISNEVGQGIVPPTTEGRAFRDHQGRLNQTLAETCDRVIEVRVGLPLQLKPSPHPAITL